jgi:hypothetical protein
VSALSYPYLVLPLLLVGCVANSPTARSASDSSAEAAPAFDPDLVRRDLEASADARFGEPLTEQAVAGDTFLIAKHYFGLAPPPELQPDGSYRDREPPVALLVKEEGRWQAARPGSNGFQPIAPDKAATLDRLVSDEALWSEPDHARAGCTDAGASLLWLKMPGRPVLVRRGACGATARTERLIFAALDA